MRHHLYIRSYAKDFEWLSYCLRSIDKFATGFEKDIAIEIPGQDLLALNSALPMLKNFTVKQFTRKRFTSDDYLGQQLSKMTCDQLFTADKNDSITHFDSDSFVPGPLSTADLLFERKPIIYMTPYAKLPPPPQMPWQPIIEPMIGFKITYEFMRRHPFTYPIWFFKELRNWMEKGHGKKFEAIIAQRPYHSCSEYNLLGAFAWEKHRASFHFVDTEAGEIPPPLVDQAWSYGGITEERRQWMDTILNG